MVEAGRQAEEKELNVMEEQKRKGWRGEDGRNTLSASVTLLKRLIDLKKII